MITVKGNSQWWNSINKHGCRDTLIKWYCMVFGYTNVAFCNSGNTDLKRCCNYRKFEIYFWRETDEKFIKSSFWNLSLLNKNIKQNYEKKVLTVMINNATNINKMKDHPHIWNQCIFQYLSWATLIIWTRFQKQPDTIIEVVKTKLLYFGYVC